MVEHKRKSTSYDATVLQPRISSGNRMGEALVTNESGAMLSHSAGAFLLLLDVIQAH